MLTVLLFALLAAQDSTAKPIETAHLVVSVSATPAPAHKVALAVDVTPKEKMHVYAPGQDGYITIVLTLESHPALTVAKAKYPASEKLFMPALNETQRVYAKPFRITQEVTVSPSAARPITVKGSLRYQACDDRICYMPVTVPLTWTLPAGTPPL